MVARFAGYLPGAYLVNIGSLVRWLRSYGSNFKGFKRKVWTVNTMAVRSDYRDARTSQGIAIANCTIIA
jgi:hypothetical protein